MVARAGMKSLNCNGSAAEGPDLLAEAASTWEPVPGDGLGITAGYSNRRARRVDRPGREHPPPGDAGPRGSLDGQLSPSSRLPPPLIFHGRIAGSIAPTTSFRKGRGPSALLRDPPESRSLFLAPKATPGRSERRHSTSAYRPVSARFSRAIVVERAQVLGSGRPGRGIRGGACPKNNSGVHRSRRTPEGPIPGEERSYCPKS